MTKAELLVQELYLSRKKTRGILKDLTDELQKSFSFEIFIEDQASDGLLVMTDDDECIENDFGVASGHLLSDVMIWVKTSKIITPKKWGGGIY